MASAIGYLDSRETGEAVALAGLTLAMFTDILQFLYMFRRLNLLEEEESIIHRTTRAVLCPRTEVLTATLSWDDSAAQLAS